MNKWIAATALMLILLSGWKTLASDTTPAPAPATAFWHLGLVVDDLDTMDRFYTEVIGLQRVANLLVEDAGVSSGNEGAIVVGSLDALMGIDGTRIEIRQYSGKQHQRFFELLHYPDHPADAITRSANSLLSLSHVGFSVPAIDAVLERMELTGLGTLASGPQTLAEFDGLRFVFLNDPEDNLVELMERSSQ